MIEAKDLKLSKKAQKELDKIRKETAAMLRPMYEELGVNINTEELHWANGEVFVIDMKTRKRRELGRSQEELNKMLMQDAIKQPCSIKVRENE